MKIKRHQLRKILHEVLNTDLRDEIALSASLGAEGAEQNDLLNEMSLLRLLEVDIDGSGDLSPDELRDLADDLEGEPLTGQELRDALISNISDMHKDIYRKRPDAHDLRQLPTEELEQEHHKTSEAHKGLVV